MHTYQNISNIEQRFAKNMQAHGLEPDDPIESDGQIHRFSSNDDPRDKAGWYVLHAGTPYWGAFGCHRGGLSEKWQDDIALYSQHPADNRENRLNWERKEGAEQQKALDRAFALWRSANDAPEAHPYLIRKGVGAYSVRRAGGILYVPVFNKEHELASLLTIQPDGQKRFLSGCKTAGGFLLIGEPKGIVCIAEGYATAASIHEATGHAVYAAFSANNLKHVAHYVRGAHFNEQIIICGDNDTQTEKNPGLTKAREAALAVGALIAIPKFGPATPNSATDFNDLMAAEGLDAVRCQIEGAFYPTTGDTGDSGELKGGTGLQTWQRAGESGDGIERLREAQLAAAVETASKFILAGLVSSIDYPMDALGPLAEVCRVISRGVQVDPAIVGQSLLGAASLLTQSVADVRAADSEKPLSLFFLTIADSGDGKSTVENIALAAITAHQRQKKQEYDLEVEAYKLETKRAKKDDPDPTTPVQPYRLMRDATVEGIRRAYEEGVPTQGVFTSEAAAMLHGYGMSADHRAKTAANLNGLWDGGELSIARVTGERVQLYDRRFAMHWMIQPSAAAEGLDDQLLIEIGLWPRFLVAWPSPGAPRKFSVFDAGKEPVIGAYWDRCTELLSLQLAESCGDLPVVYPNSEALALFAEFFEETERRAKTKNGDLTEVRAFASRATEQAFRLAGVLAVFAGDESIDVVTARNAICLVNYNLQNWLSILGTRGDNEHRIHALKLYRWLLKRPQLRTDTTSILHSGPRCVRSRARRDSAIAVLRHAGLVMIDGKEIQAVLVRSAAETRLDHARNSTASPSDSEPSTDVIA